ncbi:hypothetical protein LZF95_21015 [Algoriphagus sp. AGSA1]|uniref:hypothetical protein n=1 Tax=Algoriphagus sp. AGSA1 TaxID=2907213 RepID=UPI001F1D5B2E|nr:hypothetical protein [Algoriphagus sp. AGSA1]MCE7057175.1 hypothetical protein [Algoriphagus sp. AGSA1]
MPQALAKGKACKCPECDSGSTKSICTQSANGTISGAKTGWQAWAILVLVRRLIHYRGRFNSRYCVPVALPDHIAKSRKTCQVHLFAS